MYTEKRAKMSSATNFNNLVPINKLKKTSFIVYVFLELNQTSTLDVQLN